MSWRQLNKRGSDCRGSRHRRGSNLESASPSGAAGPAPNPGMKSQDYVSGNPGPSVWREVQNLWTARRDAVRCPSNGHW